MLQQRLQERVLPLGVGVALLHLRLLLALQLLVKFLRAQVGQGRPQVCLDPVQQCVVPLLLGLGRQVKEAPGVLLVHGVEEFVHLINAVQVPPAVEPRPVDRLDVPLDVRHRPARQPSGLRQQGDHRVLPRQRPVPLHGFHRVRHRLDESGDGVHVHALGRVPLQDGGRSLDIGDVVPGQEVARQVAARDALELLPQRLLVPFQAGQGLAVFLPIVLVVIVVPQRVDEGLAHCGVDHDRGRQGKARPPHALHRLHPFLGLLRLLQVIHRAHELVVGLRRLRHKGGRHFSG